jgi:2-methylcitrate dehydratase PrpD
VSRAPASASFGKELRIATLGLTVKKYPLCFAAHRAIDAALDLAHDHKLSAGDVESVHATVGVAQASMLRNHLPTNALEAKFSLEFALAAALVAGKVGLTELSDAFVQRADVQQFFAKVHIATTDTVLTYEPTLAASDRIVITTKDGRTLDSGEVAGTRGDAATPLADSELETKFMDCCAYGKFAGARALFDTFNQLPRSTPWKT